MLLLQLELEHDSVLTLFSPGFCQAELQTLPGFSLIVFSAVLLLRHSCCSRAKARCELQSEDHAVSAGNKGSKGSTGGARGQRDGATLGWEWCGVGEQGQEREIRRAGRGQAGGKGK